MGSRCDGTGSFSQRIIVMPTKNDPPHGRARRFGTRGGRAPRAVRLAPPPARALSRAQRGTAVSSPSSPPPSSLTLTTVSYGDMYPASPVARSMAIVEAMIGIIFVAVFISRLIRLRTGRSRQSDLPSPKSAAYQGFENVSEACRRLISYFSWRDSTRSPDDAVQQDGEDDERHRDVESIVLQ